MLRLSEFFRRLQILFRRDQFASDLDEEMRLHRELRAEEDLKSGASSVDRSAVPHQVDRFAVADQNEAHYAASRRFGNAASLRERSRDAWGFRWLEHLIQDASYGLRTMVLRTPGLTIVAVLSLALGIGANTAIFSLLDAVLLRSLPVQDPNRLVLFGHGIEIGSTGDLPDRSWGLFSYPFYREFGQKTDAFSGVAAVNSIQFGGHGSVAGGRLELFRIDLVSGTYFNVLGVGPALGRVLAESDDRTPGGGPVAVASYSWWKQRFGGDPTVVGRTVKILSTEYTIVGVAQPGFFGATVGQSADLWIPLSMEKEISPGWNGLQDKFFESLYLIARLKPGVTVEQASANTNLLFKQILRSDYVGPQPSPKDLESIQHAQIELTPAARGLSRLRMQMSLPLEILMVLVGLVLLIACANIANLLLARGASRSREIAVRIALGATRRRLIAQLFTESSLLALAGAALGLLFAWKAGYLLLAMASGGSEPAPVDVSPDIRVLLFTLLLTGLTAFLFGMAPAIRATRLDSMTKLKEGRGGISGPSRNSLARILVVAQIAFSLILLATAALFLHSLVNLTHVDTGFDRQNVLVFGLDEYALNLPEDERLIAIQNQIEDRVKALPGVRAASFSMFTFNQGEWSDPVVVQGVTRTPENSQEILFNSVGNDFFSAFGIPLLEGRGFTPQDTPRSPKVAVINQTMERRFFGNGSALGHRFNFGDEPAGSDEQFEIVGVARDAKYVGLSEQPQMVAYFPYSQHILYFSNFSVRYSGDPRAIISEVRAAISDVNRSIVVSHVGTLAEQVDRSIADQSLIAQLSAFFGALAVFLVCIGIYGLLSYAVARRTNEIGIRMALGAGRFSVQWLILREILLLVAIGLTLGIPVALGGANLIVKLENPHLLNHMLFGITPNDPVALAVAIVLMVLVAAFTGYMPARRASRLDPIVALRHE
jgi:predicted permease